MDDQQPATTMLYLSPSRQRCSEDALVLHAMGIPYQILALDEGFALVVKTRDVRRAQEQLSLYWQENPGRPQIRADPRQGLYDGLICASLYGIAILLMDLVQRHHALGLDWWQAGLAQAGLIWQGEWWRTLTALSLHGDGVHLGGNLLFGMVFGFLAGQRLGWGLAFSGMVLAGALGNGLNALIQSSSHSSIGASTAVFAAVGLVAATSWIGRRHQLNRWVPLAAGVALLAFLGMGGERTDIFAHLAGFAWGCLLGAGYALLEPRLGWLTRHQHAAGLAALALCVVAWWAALAA